MIIEWSEYDEDNDDDNKWLIMMITNDDYDLTRQLSTTENLTNLLTYTHSPSVCIIA